MPLGLGFGLQFGSRGGGAAGDATRLTPASFDALFADYTSAGTGAVWGELGKPGTLAVPVVAVAENDIPLAAALASDLGSAGSGVVYGLLVSPAATNSVTRTDLGHAGWAKSNAVASLVAGTLDAAASWRGTSLVGTETRQTFSGPLPAIDGDGYIVARSVGVPVNNYLQVVVPTSGAATYIRYRVEDDNTVPGVIGATVQDASTVLSTKTVAGEYEIIYRFTGNVRLAAANGSSHKITLLEMAEVKAHSLLTATGTDGTASFAITRASGDCVGSVWAAADPANSGSCYARLSSTGAEVEIPKSALPQMIELPTETVANPTLRLRIATSTDKLHYYDGQSIVDVVPYRPRIGPSIGSALSVGARSIGKSITAPTSLDIEFLSEFNGLRTAFYFQLSSSDVAAVYSAAGNILRIRANASTNHDTTLTHSLVTGDTFKIRFQWDGANVRARVNDGAWQDGVYKAFPASITSANLGGRGASDPCGMPIWAFRDYAGNLELPSNGWNHDILDGFTP